MPLINVRGHFDFINLDSSMPANAKSTFSIYLNTKNKTFMYGIVNKGIRDMVLRNYGEETWDKIRVEAKCEEDFFMSMEIYDDAITYDLVGAASIVLNTSAHNILVAFGEFWMQFTAIEGYGDVLQIAGVSFPQFLRQLDTLHTRLGATYKKLIPPSFICNEIDEQTLLLEYHSHRKGLTSLAIGIVQGLGKKFNMSVEIQHLKKQEDVGFDEFLVKYFPLPEMQTTEPVLNQKKPNNEKGKCPFGGSR